MGLSCSVELTYVRCDCQNSANGIHLISVTGGLYSICSYSIKPPSDVARAHIGKESLVTPAGPFTKSYIVHLMGPITICTVDRGSIWSLYPVVSR